MNNIMDNINSIRNTKSLIYELNYYYYLLGNNKINIEKPIFQKGLKATIFMDVGINQTNQGTEDLLILNQLK